MYERKLSGRLWAAVAVCGGDQRRGGGKSYNQTWRNASYVFQAVVMARAVSRVFNGAGIYEIIPLAASGLLFALALLFEERFAPLFGGMGTNLIYAIAYIAAAYPVLRNALRTLFSSNFLNEFFLMSFASIAAIAIGKFPEAISVMLFYRVGEFFQEMAASKSRRSIKSPFRTFSGEISTDSRETSIPPARITRAAEGFCSMRDFMDLRDFEAAIS